MRCPDLLLLFLFHCRRRPGPALVLLFHFSYTAAPVAVSSSTSLVTQHSFPVQPASICPLLLSPQLHFPSNKNANLVVRSLTRVDHLIASHLISSGPFQDPPNPPEMSYTTQLSDIKQSLVQTLLQTKKKLYNLYFQKTLKRKAKMLEENIAHLIFYHSYRKTSWQI